MLVARAITELFLRSIKVFKSIRGIISLLVKVKCEYIASFVSVSLDSYLNENFERETEGEVRKD